MDFKDYLEERTKELAKPVYDFMETLALYEGEQDTSIDDQCIIAYRKAIDSVMIWLRLVELLDIADSKYMEALTVLNLPEHDIDVSVKTRTLIGTESECRNHKEFVSEIKGYDEGHKVFIGTPIGEMSDATLKYILGVENNPVVLLYKHLSYIVHGIHNILSMPLHGSLSSDIVLTEDLLKEHNIQDVLHVYRMDRILFDIDNFFESKMP